MNEILDLLKSMGAPTWIVISLLVINIFKVQLSAIIKTLWAYIQKVTTQEVEHNNEMEEVRVNAGLQKEAAEQLRLSYIEENLMDMLKKQSDFDRELFHNITRVLEDQHQLICDIKIVLSEISITLRSIQDKKC